MTSQKGIVPTSSDKEELTHFASRSKINVENPCGTLRTGMVVHKTFIELETPRLGNHKRSSSCPPRQRFQSSDDADLHLPCNQQNPSNSLEPNSTYVEPKNDHFPKFSPGP